MLIERNTKKEKWKISFKKKISSIFFSMKLFYN